MRPQSARSWNFGVLNRPKAVGEIGVGVPKCPRIVPKVGRDGGTKGGDLKLGLAAKPARILGGIEGFVPSKVGDTGVALGDTGGNWGSPYGAVAGDEGPETRPDFGVPGQGLVELGSGGPRNVPKVVTRPLLPPPALQPRLPSGPRSLPAAIRASRSIPAPPNPPGPHPQCPAAPPMAAGTRRGGGGRRMAADVGGGRAHPGHRHLGELGEKAGPRPQSAGGGGGSATAAT